MDKLFSWKTHTNTYTYIICVYIYIQFYRHIIHNSIVYMYILYTHTYIYEWNDWESILSLNLINMPKQWQLLELLTDTKVQEWNAWGEWCPESLLADIQIHSGLRGRKGRWLTASSWKDILLDPESLDCGECPQHSVLMPFHKIIWIKKSAAF